MTSDEYREAMIDLPTPIVTDKMRDRVRDIAIRQGRVARACGQPKKPPRFVDPDMTVNWSMGWRWEDEEIKARRQRSQGIGLRRAKRRTPPT